MNLLYFSCMSLMVRSFRLSKDEYRALIFSFFVFWICDEIPSNQSTNFGLLLMTLITVFPLQTSVVASWFLPFSFHPRLFYSFANPCNLQDFYDSSISISWCQLLVWILNRFCSCSSAYPCYHSQVSSFEFQCWYIQKCTFLQWVWWLIG